MWSGSEGGHAEVTELKDKVEFETISKQEVEENVPASSAVASILSTAARKGKKKKRRLV